ncbi:7322_t:CDS:10 [Ambispora leptoticha]|uniref:DNA polymerase kappa n=1 Tax=Ambispora leptoticha TaxID=144679 RepID=A0A9N9ANA9_9GLOM|nr:7322_t:CDS:10 [Ambispora leptoticha]
MEHKYETDNLDLLDNKEEAKALDDLSAFADLCNSTNSKRQIDFSGDSEENVTKQMNHDIEKEIKSNRDNESLRDRISGLAATKAGMQGVDKEKVKRLIYESSKGSAFFQNEKKKDEATSEKINEMLQKYETIKKSDLLRDSIIVESKVKELEQLRDMTQTIVHIDMDAFFAAVEERDDPTLRGKPMAVGSMSMLTTANYEARKFGVRSAMPGFIAKRLCPQLILVPCHFEKYTEVSKEVQKVFAKYDPQFAAMSLDEAYLNITDYLNRTKQQPAEVTQQIRDDIFHATQLTSSAGIAPNKMLAKICSDINKPNGQYQLENDRQVLMNFIKDLSIRKISGIGRVTERILNVLEIHTCGDLLEKLVIVYKLFKPASFNFLAQVALGVGSTDVAMDWNRKSIGVERTFPPLKKPQDLREKLRELAVHLENDLAKENLEAFGRNISLKFKLTSFELFTRAKTLPKYIHNADDLYKYGEQILKAEMPFSLRLLGLRLSALRDRNEELKYGVKKYFPVKEENQEENPQKKLRLDTQDSEDDMLQESTFNTPIASDSSENMSYTDTPDNSECPTYLEKLTDMNHIQSASESSKCASSNIKTKASTSQEDNLFEHKPTNKILQPKSPQLSATTPNKEASAIVHWECPICDQKFSNSSELRIETHTKRTTLSNVHKKSPGRPKSTSKSGVNNTSGNSGNHNNTSSGNSTSSNGGNSTSNGNSTQSSNSTSNSNSTNTNNTSSTSGGDQSTTTTQIRETPSGPVLTPAPSPTNSAGPSRQIESIYQIAVGSVLAFVVSAIAFSF